MSDFRYEAWTIVAGEDLDDTTKGTGHIFKAVALDDGQVATTGKEAGGLLQRAGGKSGEHTQLGIGGIMKFTAGAAVAAGDRLTVNGSGYCIAATSGSYVIGRVLDTAAVSGEVGWGAFDFMAPSYFGVQSGGTLP